MIQVIEQTRDEKIAMYLKMTKRELAEMLVNANEALSVAAQQPPPTYVYIAPPQIEPRPIGTGTPLPMFPTIWCGA